MADYIERDKAKEEILSWAVCINHPEHLMREDAIHVLDSIKAADVVKVVRCKECMLKSMCVHHNGRNIGQFDENAFCSYGERKEGADHG